MKYFPECNEATKWGELSDFFLQLSTAFHQQCSIILTEKLAVGWRSLPSTIENSFQLHSGFWTHNSSSSSVTRLKCETITNPGIFALNCKTTAWNAERRTHGKSFNPSQSQKTTNAGRVCVYPEIQSSCERPRAFNESGAYEECVPFYLYKGETTAAENTVCPH